MQRLAIFVNDASYAKGFLEPLLAQASDAARCTLVLCPPRLSHRIGKWLSNRQRQQWQRSWTDRLRLDLSALLPPDVAARLEWEMASLKTSDTTAQLRRRHGPSLQVLDIRRPQLGQRPSAIEPGAAPVADDRWKAPVAVSSSLSVVLALVD